jgi:CDP-glycerol glycerophosphotransferase (TagB/SpsB family)
VSVVHDQSARLSAFIAAVEGQQLPLEELQVLMVDVGSTDDSLDQLRSWEARSPGLVSVLEAPGSSIGAARNAGLSRARGQWVSFPHPCDGWEPDYLVQVAGFVETHPMTVFVSTNRLVAGEGGENATNTHPRRMFHRRDRVLNLNLTPEIIAGDPTSSFFRTDALRRHDVTFDDLWSTAPDAFSFAWRILLRSEQPLVGLMRSAKYHQRRGIVISGTPATMIPREPLTEEPTLKMLRVSYLDTLDEAAARPDGVPEWLQHQIVVAFAHFFASNDSRPPGGVPVTPEGRARFHSTAALMIGRLDADDVIPYLMGRVARTARYVLQFGYRDTSWIQPFVLMSNLDDDQHLVKFSYFFTGGPPTEEFRANGEPTTPVHAKTRKLYYSGRHLMSHRIAWLPFQGLMEVRLDGSPADLAFEYPPFPRKRVTQQHAGWFLRPDTTRVLGPAKRVTPPVAHTREGRRAQRVATRARWSRKFAEAWVLMDRIHDARDNGEALFKFLRSEHPEINAWFVLEKDSPHWARLVEEGYKDRLVAHGGIEWRVLMLHCRHLLSSHSDPAVTSPQAIREIRLLDYRFTFLQHGVIMFDLSNWMNAKRLDTLVTSTPGEFHSIAGDESQYMLTTREVSLTGLPRWDRLLEMARHQANVRDLLLVAPTWRKWLLPPIVPGSQKRPLDLSVLTSDFFRHWQRFLSDPRLEKLAQEHGLGVGILPHPNLQPVLEHLDLPDHVVRLTYADNDIQELISRARLMVTDYSSISFDAAYVGRPVIYYQFDTEQMLEGSHVGTRGYFDYERDGFGPVATTLDDILHEVQRAIEAGPDPMPQYAARSERTFPTRDGGCCERVIEAVRRSTRAANAHSVTPTPPASEAWR